MKQIKLSEFLAMRSIDELKNGSVFGAISKEAIQYLLNRGEIFNACRGDIVFDYGDKGDNFFIICLGMVDFYKYHEGACLKTRSAEFGEALGFVAMIALHDHVGQAIVQQDSLLLKVSADLFSDFHTNFPFDFGIFTLNLARDMARTLRKLNNDLVTLSV